jgi:hypothetical protein
MVTGLRSWPYYKPVLVNRGCCRSASSSGSESGSGRSAEAVGEGTAAGVCTRTSDTPSAETAYDKFSRLLEHALACMRCDPGNSRKWVVR